MIRHIPPLLLVVGLTSIGLPASAQTVAPAPRHAHKMVKPVKTEARKPSSDGGINTPSTDFSTVERAGDDDGADKGPGSNVRPVIGAGGNIGFGTGF